MKYLIANNSHILKDKMDKAKANKFIVFLLITLIVIALGLTAFLYKIFTSEGGQCLANPMKYAENKIEEQNNNSVIVSCECRDAKNGGFVGIDDLNFSWNEE